MQQEWRVIKELKVKGSDNIDKKKRTVEKMRYKKKKGKYQQTSLPLKWLTMFPIERITNRLKLKIDINT